MLKQREAFQLFQDYSYYREQTAYYRKAKKQNPYLRPLKATQARLGLFADMVNWCREKKIPPRQWLYSLFEVRVWNFAPKLERGHLLSEKYASKYGDGSQFDLEPFTRYVRRENFLERLGKPEHGFDPNSDINFSTEQAKKDYLARGGPDKCREYMGTETFGFHPKSTVCNKCVDRDKCLNELRGKVNFDILALRRGLITSRQAQHQAFMGQKNDG